MTLNFEKILKFFGGSPYRYWSWFLIVFFSLVILVIFFGVYRFQKASRVLSEPIILENEEKIKAPSRPALDQIIDVLNKKSENFEKIKVNTSSQ